MRRLAALMLLAAVARPQGAAAQEPGPAWSFSASALWYVDADPGFLLPIATADHAALHLEARWNYEDLDTFSGWVGWTLATGRAVTLAATPMLGGVVGRSDGVAPGLELTIGWHRLELYSEAEYLLATGDGEDFLYTWTQLTWRPREWLGVGLSGQRLRSSGSDLTIDRGPLVEFSRGPVSLTGWFYNPFSADAFTVLGASITF